MADDEVNEEQQEQLVVSELWALAKPPIPEGGEDDEGDNKSTRKVVAPGAKVGKLIKSRSGRKLRRKSGRSCSTHQKKNPKPRTKTRHRSQPPTSLCSKRCQSTTKNGECVVKAS